MARQYRTGLIITGDATGGIKAIQATEKELGQLNQGFDRGGKRARQFGQDADRAGRQLDGVTDNASETSRELDVLRGAAVSVGAALAGAFAVNNLAAQADMIRNTDALAQSLQVNTRTLQQWQFAGQSVGLQADKIGDIFKDVSDKVGDFAATGGGEAAELFENLNLNIRELQSLSPDQQILRIAEAIGEVEDPSQRSFYFESLADEMVRLQPLLANGAEGLRDAAEMADALGVAMDDMEVQRAVEAAESMDQLQGVAQGLANTLIADLGPGLADATQNVIEFVDAMGGADEIAEQLLVVGGSLAVLVGGRLVKAYAAHATSVFQSIAAERQMQTAAAATAKAELMAAQNTQRRAAAEAYSAKRLLGRAQAEARATAGTEAHSAALARLNQHRRAAVAASAQHRTAINATTAAQQRYTASARVAATATRGLSGAMALIGGPAGAAVLAGFAIYEMADSANQAITPTERLKNETAALRNELYRLSEAEVESRLTQNAIEMAEQYAKVVDLRRQIQEQKDAPPSEPDAWYRGANQDAAAVDEARIAALEAQIEQATDAQGELTDQGQLLKDRLEEIKEASDNAGNSFSVTTEASKEAEQAAREQANALEQLRNEMNPMRGEAQTLAERVSVLNQGLADGTIGVVEHAQAMAWAAEEYARAGSGAEEYEKRTESLVGEYDRQHQRAEQLAQDLEDINERYRRGEIDGATYQRMVGNVRDGMRELSAESDPLAQDMARAWTEAADRIDETFADAFTGAFDSFDDFADQLMDGFKRLLGELAYQATLRPVVVEFTSGMQDLLGLGGGQGGGLSSLFGGGGQSGGIAWGDLAKYGQSAWSAISGVGPAVMSGYQAGGLSGALSGGAGYYGDMLSSGLGALGFGGGGATAGGIYANAATGASIYGSTATGGVASGGMSGALSSMGAAWPLAIAAGIWQSGELYDQGVRPNGGALVEAGGDGAVGTAGMLPAALQSQFFEGVDGLLEPLVGGKAAAMISGSTFHQALWSGIGEKILGPIDEWLGIGDFLDIGGIADSIGLKGKYAGEDPTGTLKTVNEFGAAGRAGFEREAFATGALGDIGFARESRDIDSLFGERDDFDAAKEYAEQLAQLDNAVAALADSEEELDAMRQAAAGRGLSSIQEVDQRYIDILSTLGGDIRGMLEGFQGNTGELVQFAGLLDSTSEALAGNQQALADVRAEVNRYSDDVEASMGAAQAMARAAQTMELLETGVERLNLQFDATAQGAIHAASELQAMAGGIQNLQGLQQSYYQAFYSQAEQAAHLQEDLSEQFAALNVALPDTRDGFRELVEAQDLNTAAGRETYLGLLNLSGAFDQLSQSSDEVVDASRIAEQRARMEIEILRLQGRESEALAREREMELDALHDSLDPLQERIWALQDAKEAEEERNQAMQQAREQIEGFTTSINSWLDQLESTDQGMGTPSEQLDAANAAYNEQLAAARSGDRDALGSITQYADRLIEAQKGWSASGVETTDLIDRIEQQLGELPDQLSPEQFLAQEFQSTIDGQTEELASTLAEVSVSLARQFDSLDLNADGLIDWEEFYRAFEGLATDAELRHIYQQLDTNGDGTISRLEAVRGNTESLQDARLDGLKVSLGRHHEPGAWQDAAYNFATVWGNMGISGWASAAGGELESGTGGSSSGSSGSGGSSGGGSTSGGSSSGSNAPARARSWIDMFWQYLDDVDGSRGLRYLEREYLSLSGAENYVGAALDRIQGLGGNIPSGRVSDLDDNWSFFAQGGVFTNTLVNEPTAFDMGVMGEAGPEAIMPLHRGPGGSLGVRAELPPPVPALPLLGQSDVVEALNDLRRENQRLRQDLNQVLGRIEQHGAAGVRVQQAGLQRVADNTARTAETTERMDDRQRLEATR